MSPCEVRTVCGPYSISLVPLHFQRPRVEDRQNLETVYLPGNALTDLGFLLSSNGGTLTTRISSEAGVYVSGNTLGQVALCNQIPALQAQISSVIYDGAC